MQIRYKSEYSFRVRREGLCQGRGHADKGFLNATINVALFPDVQTWSDFSPAYNVTKLSLLGPPPQPPPLTLGTWSTCARLGTAGQRPHTALGVRIAAAFLGSHLAFCTESPGPWMCFDSVVFPPLSVCLQGGWGCGCGGRSRGIVTQPRFAPWSLTSPDWAFPALIKSAGTEPCVALKIRWDYALKCLT